MARVKLSDYQDRFRTIRIERDDDGILTATLHSDGDSICWGVRPHDELTTFWETAGHDRDTNAIVITGTGDSFINRMDDGDPNWISAAAFAAMAREARRLCFNPLEVPVPVLADVVLATPDTFFADLAHYPSGIVPGDGIQAVFMTLFGVNRGRYLLYTGERVSAEDALACGAIAEIVPRNDLLSRATELALRIASKPKVTTMTTRMLLNAQLQQLMLDATTTGAFAEGMAAMDHWPTVFATNRQDENS